VTEEQAVLLEKARSFLAAKAKKKE